jgi:hypothetical protein
MVLILMFSGAAVKMVVRKRLKNTAVFKGALREVRYSRDVCKGKRK